MSGSTLTKKIENFFMSGQSNFLLAVLWFISAIGFAISGCGEIFVLEVLLGFCNVQLAEFKSEKFAKSEK